ncbi:MAG: hypothetical protein U5K54_06600 [Cytophagales bacterium]|nr:hypothetical protein [Cytophagales bacterium]
MRRSTTDKSEANVTKIVMDGYDFVINSVKKIDPTKLQEQTKVFGRFENVAEDGVRKSV